MTTRFGFDDAGVGFDQAPFASIYADKLLEAGKTLPAFSTSVTLQTRTPTRHEIQAVKTFPAASHTATVDDRTPTRHAIAAAATFNALTATAMVQNRAPTRHVITAAKTFPSATSTVAVNSESPLTATATFPAITTTATLGTRTPNRHSVEAMGTFGALASTATASQRIPDILPVAPAIDDMGGFVGIDVGTITLPVATGGNTPLTYSSLRPANWLFFDNSNRQVTGTPSATGAFNVTYAVEDSDGDTDASGFVWRIADYDDTGKTVSARMYVVAGDSELYRAGQHGTLLSESDAAIDNVDITINRIRYQTTQGLLFLNRSGSDSFQTEFENTNGAYNTGNWQIVLTTATDSITWDIPADVNAGTGAGNLRSGTDRRRRNHPCRYRRIPSVYFGFGAGQSVELAAATTFPAFTSAATVQTRAVDRHEIQAAKTFGASVHCDGNRKQSHGHAPRAYCRQNLPAVTATVDVGSESLVEGVKTFPAFTGTSQCPDTPCNSPCCNGGGNIPGVGKHGNGHRPRIAGCWHDNPSRVHGNGQRSGAHGGPQGTASV